MSWNNNKLLWSRSVAHTGITAAFVCFVNVFPAEWAGMWRKQKNPLTRFTNCVSCAIHCRNVLPDYIVKLQWRFWVVYKAVMVLLFASESENIWFNVKDWFSRDWFWMWKRSLIYINTLWCWSLVLFDTFYLPYNIDLMKFIHYTFIHEHLEKNRNVKINWFIFDVWFVVCLMGLAFAFCASSDYTLKSFLLSLNSVFFE